jgi:squalene-hopene/tetraprenyl-beta-curcumene cyclase
MAELARFEQGIEDAVERGAQHLLSLQAEEGYWLGELEADTTLESDYIFYLHVLGNADPKRIAKLANYVRRRQLEDGGWNIYFGGPSELNATVKAYFALKLAGDSADAPHMGKARDAVHRLGGLEKTNSFTRFYFSLVGALGWDMVPAVPPELMLLPNWFYLNIYEMSSWTRGILIPLAILYAHKPRWTLPVEARVDELFRDPSHKRAAFEWDRQQLLSWRNFFLALDRALKLYERIPWKPLRQRALRQAKSWLYEHLERSEGLAAIYPAMMNAIFALIALGHSPDDPLTAREIRELGRFEIEDEDTLRMQPCMSPVWDTAIAMVALEEAGVAADDPALVKATDWLLNRQVLGPGDWQVKNPSAPGGWVFEFRNDFYPDVDDTAFVLMALQRVDFPDRKRLENATRRGIEWLVSMQNHDGGWGAFDHNNDCHVFTQVPFADHNAMIDPSTADVTARVLECLGRFGWSASHPVVKRGVQFLLKDQAPDGSWYGRWGVNYVYGSSGVLRALETLGLTAREYCQRTVAWLHQVQNTDGGFGETIASYYDASLKGKGRSTPSQTAWGLIGLLAASDLADPAVGRSISHLVSQQNADGSWDEQEFTGTGFPCVFYLKYHLYRNYFPLYALARYRNLKQQLPWFRALEIRPEEIRLWEGTRVNS